MAKAVEKKRVLHRRRIIERPRLIALLDEANVPIRMLIAPAGYGKTTLAEQWVAKEGRRGTWFTARPASVDVAALALGLARAAAGIVPDCEERLREHLRALPAPAENVRVLAEILSEDIAGWPNDAWLVFDDYHEICPSADAERFVEELVSLCPVQILIASRQRPSWVKARRILYGEVFELNQTQLAMDGHEAAEVLSGRNATSASGLVALANGWPAVIGLAAVSSAELVDQESVPEALYQFFADEIFSALDTEVQVGLATLALAPVLDRPLVIRLLGEGADRICSAALDVGILVEREGRLDIHPLARAFLDEQRDQGRSPREGAVSLCMAYFRECRDWDASFDLATRLGRPSDLESLLGEALDELLDTARLPTIDSWCEHAMETGATAPIFELGRAEVALRRGRLAEAQTHAESVDSANALFCCRALLIAGRAAHLASREDEALDLYRKAEAAATTDEMRRDARGGQVLCMIDLEMPEALDLTDELAASAPRVAREVVRSAIHRLSCQIMFSSLDLTEADRVSQVASAVGDPLVESSFWSVYSSALALTGRYDDALVAATSLLEIARRYRLDFALPYALSSAGNAEAGLRNWERSEQHLIEGIGHARGVSNAHAEQHCLAAYIRTLTQQGKRHQAVALASDGAARQPAPVTITMFAELAATRALALVLADRVDESLQLIDSIRGVSQGIEVQAIVAAVDAIGGLKLHSAEAIATAEDFAISTLATGAINLLVTAYRSSPELLTVLLRSKKCSDDIFRVVQRSRDEDLAVALGLPPPSEDNRLAQLTARQREVYGLLRQGLTNREIATLLYITEATAKLHVQNIYDRTGVHSRKAIAMQAALERSTQATSAIDDTGADSDS